MSSQNHGPFDEPTFRCECGGRLTEIDAEDLDDMTEGQMADYLAGFNHPFHCGACGQVVLRDVG